MNADSRRFRKIALTVHAIQKSYSMVVVIRIWIVTFRSAIDCFYDLS